MSRSAHLGCLLAKVLGLGSQRLLSNLQPGLLSHSQEECCNILYWAEDVHIRLVCAAQAL